MVGVLVPVSVGVAVMEPVVAVAVGLSVPVALAIAVVVAVEVAVVEGSTVLVGVAVGTPQVCTGCCLCFESQTLPIS